MTSNKDTAANSMVIAEKKLKENDISDAKRFASIALNLYPELDGLSQLIEVIDVHIAYAKTVYGEIDWYGVLSVDPSADDEWIRTNFRKLALSLHPDKNKASYAEGAFKILSQAWSILSDKDERETYDQRLRRLEEGKWIPPMQSGTNGVHLYAGDSSSTRCANSASRPSMPESFWTMCRSCNTYFQYKFIYLNRLLQCIKCREQFFAVAQTAPPQNGRKSLKPISIFQHPPARQNPASSVPSNLGGNFLPTANTGTNGLSGDGSTGDKKFLPGLTKNPSEASSSSFQPLSGSSGDEKIQPGGTNCQPGSSAASFGDPSDPSRFFQRNSLLAPNMGISDFSQADIDFKSKQIFRLGSARSTSGPVTSFYSASDDSQNLLRTFSPEHVKKPTDGAFRPGGAGSAFSHFPAAYNMPSHSERTSSPAPITAATSFSGPSSTSEDIRLRSIFIPGGAKTSSGPAVSSFQAAPCVPKDYGRIFSSVPVTGITASSSVQTNPEYGLPQVLGNVKHDLSKTENKESSNSRGKLMENRQANEHILLSKGRSGMANKKASKSGDSRPDNQFTNKNNNLGAGQNLVHGSSKSKNDGNFSHLHLRTLLIQKAKSDINKKLTEWSRPSPSFPTPNIYLKKPDSTDTAEGSDAPSVKKAKKVDLVLQNVQCCHPVQTSSVASACENMDTKTMDYVTMDVPDPDFHDFDQHRIEKLFSEGQVWALYDDDDGMPRFYALINSVKSVNPFKIKISRLNSKANTEIGPMEWITCGFTKTSGDFRIGRSVVCNALSSFSHIVKSKSGPKGVIQIFPGKGETWALYKKWSSSWNELTPEEEVHQYDIVLVLDDYNEQQGVLVAPLVKVSGFRSVFRQHDPERSQTIQKEELFRFSHQVPSYTLTGEEAQNAPKGYVELDTAAMPFALLQLIQEEDAVKEDFNSQDIYPNPHQMFINTYSRRNKKRHTLLSEEIQIP